MPNIEQRVENAINKSLLSFLKARHPDRLFTINFQGDIAVDGVDVGLERVEQAAAGGEPVTGHWRRSTKGRWTWIASHARQKEMPSAMDLALIEEQEEQSPTFGFSVEETVQEFLQVVSQPNSLQRFL